jgi:hypothetical protein
MEAVAIPMVVDMARLTVQGAPIRGASSGSKKRKDADEESAFPGKPPRHGADMVKQNKAKRAVGGATANAQGIDHGALARDREARQRAKAATMQPTMQPTTLSANDNMKAGRPKATVATGLRTMGEEMTETAASDALIPFVYSEGLYTLDDQFKGLLLKGSRQALTGLSSNLIFAVSRDMCKPTR